MIRCCIFENTREFQKNKIHLHGKKLDNNWQGTSQSHKWHRGHKTTNKDTQLKQQNQSWEVKKKLVGRNMATNDMTSQQMAICQWHFQLSSTTSPPCHFLILDASCCHISPCNVSFWDLQYLLIKMSWFTKHPVGMLSPLWCLVLRLLWFWFPLSQHLVLRHLMW